MVEILPIGDDAVWYLLYCLDWKWTNNQCIRSRWKLLWTQKYTVPYACGSIPQLSPHLSRIWRKTFFDANIQCTEVGVITSLESTFRKCRTIRSHGSKINRTHTFKNCWEFYSKSNGTSTLRWSEIMRPCETVPYFNFYWKSASVLNWTQIFTETVIRRLFPSDCRITPRLLCPPDNERYFNLRDSSVAYGGRVHGHWGGIVVHIWVNMYPSVLILRDFVPHSGSFCTTVNGRMHTKRRRPPTRSGSFSTSY